MFSVFQVAEKILEHKKFGQDLLTTEDTADPHPMSFPVGSPSTSRHQDCSNKATRERVLLLIFLARCGSDMDL